MRSPTGGPDRCTDRAVLTLEETAAVILRVAVGGKAELLVIVRVNDDRVRLKESDGADVVIAFMIASASLTAVLLDISAVWMPDVPSRPAICGAVPLPFKSWSSIFDGP
jgi:hypothetical protein